VGEDRRRAKLILWEREIIVAGRESMKSPPDFMTWTPERVVSIPVRTVSGRELMDSRKRSSSPGRRG
jgi:hypothetical protein